MLNEVHGYSRSCPVIWSGRRKIKLRNARNILLALTVLCSGMVNLLSVVSPAIPERSAVLREIFPLVFIHLSRFLSLLTGFTLVVLSINIYMRKKRAFRITLLLSILSVLFYLTKGLDYEEATLSVILIVLLMVQPENLHGEEQYPESSVGFIAMGVALIAAFLYGIVGFWFLDTREFGVNFTIGESVKQTLSSLMLMRDPGIVPRTHHARWFLDSLNITTAMAIVYALFAVFRPAVYRLRTLPLERKRAEDITARFGRSALDFFLNTGMIKPFSSLKAGNALSPFG